MAEIRCYKCDSVIPRGFDRCPNCGAPAPLPEDEVDKKKIKESILGGGRIAPTPSPTAPGTRAPRPADDSATRVVRPDAPGATRVVRPDEGASTRVVRPDEGNSTRVVRPDEGASTRIVRPDEGSATRIVNPAPATTVINPQPSPRPQPVEQPIPQQPTPQPSAGNGSSKKNKKDGNSNSIVFIIIAVIVAAAIGIFLYFNSKSSDDNAELRFAIIETPIVERPDSHVSIARIPFGGKMLVYERDGIWCKVKYIPSNGSTIKGYVEASNLISDVDYNRLRSLAPNTAALNALPDPNFRLALVNYLSAKGYAGPGDNIDGQSIVNPLRLYAPTDAQGNQTNVLIGPIYNPNSNDRDLAVILQTIDDTVTDGNILLFFTFDQYGTSRLRLQKNVGDHTIIDGARRTDASGPNAVEFTTR